jgi:hemoglobin
MSDIPQTPYQIMGEDGIRELANVFYDVMDALPEASGIRAMHAADLSPMKEKLAQYLTGWMGGPPRYADKHGTVCMTEPHEPFHIGPEERNRALEQTSASAELVEMLRIPLFRVADAVRNKEGPSSAATNPNVIAAN